jgi:hypothetical protein
MQQFFDFIHSHVLFGLRQITEAKRVAQEWLQAHEKK